MIKDLMDVRVSSLISSRHRLVKYASPDTIYIIHRMKGIRYCPNHLNVSIIKTWSKNRTLAERIQNFARTEFLPSLDADSLFSGRSSRNSEVTGKTELTIAV